MTLDEIKSTVDAGHKVYWVHNGYEVIKDNLGQYLIRYETGDCIGLTHQDGITLNGKEKEFFTIKTKKKAPDLLDALYIALPFVEDHEDSEVYKPGVVKDAVKKIRAAIASAEK
jgi:hypothetical protein